MRIALLLLLIIPFLSEAQVNRSAKELASEKIQEYVVTRLFKGKPYKSDSYGELKSYVNKKNGIVWAMEHKFEITETDGFTDNSGSTIKQYKFLFFLDKKMNVVKAESFFSI